MEKKKKLLVFEYVLATFPMMDDLPPPPPPLIRQNAMWGDELLKALDLPKKGPDK